MTHALRHSALLKLAAIASSLCISSVGNAAETLTETAQQALIVQMGDDAQSMHVEVLNGVATLSGWAANPAAVDKARYIVSQVPGIVSSYSVQVHTWAQD